MDEAEREPAHVVIPTHTPRYLELVLAGLSRQTVRPETITVSCDVDDPAIGDMIRTWSSRLGLRVSWVRRAHHGGERLCQVRNNAVRHVVDDLGWTSGRVIVLDGDMVASSSLVEQHLSEGSERELVYAYRVNVSREVSESLTPEGLLSGGQSLEVSSGRRGKLRQRQRRYERHLLLRRFGLAPRHKPKLLGGHFSVTLNLYLRLNGFDELYQGWGFKDDEFARRAARLGAVPAVAVDRIIAWHLWHRTRQAPGPMRTLPTARRFARRDLPMVADHGVRNSLPQHEVLWDVIA